MPPDRRGRCDMAVERIVAGVDDGAGEPAAIGAHRGIEDLLAGSIQSISRAASAQKPSGSRANGRGPRGSGCSRWWSWRTPGSPGPSYPGEHYSMHCHGKMRQIKPEWVCFSAKPESPGDHTPLVLPAARSVDLNPRIA